MSSEDNSSPSADPKRLSPQAQSSMEALLATVGPRGMRLDRDRLMFLAGRASVGGATDSAASTGLSESEDRRQLGARRDREGFWRMLSMAMMAVAAMLAAALLMNRYSGQLAHVTVPRDPTVETSSSKADNVAGGNVSPGPGPSMVPSEDEPVQHLAKLKGNQHLRLREIALRHGVESLPNFFEGGNGAAPLSTSYLRRLYRPDGDSTSNQHDLENLFETTAQPRGEQL